MHTAQEYMDHKLPIMEHFYSIQGEGFHSGRAAYFIRLAGCDVGCVWCDVKESWDADLHPKIKVIDLVEAVKINKADFVVITGGEPTLYNLTSLITALQQEGIEVAIETSGTNILHKDVDWYCFSPKKFKTPIPEAFQKANELKVIINHPSDFQWAQEQSLKLNTKCKLFLQAEWSKEDRFLPDIIEFVKNNPKWRISLQTHKYMKIP